MNMSVVSRNTPTSPFEAKRVPEPGPNPELLSSLGRLVRGLSALFWGLPLALVLCVQSAKSDWLRPLGVVPALITTTLLYHGLVLLGHFQQQERVWRLALDRAKALALINIGFAPFLYFWNRVPANPYFEHVVHLLVVTGMLFLLFLNPMLLRLALMLPDETLRVETRVFTKLNQVLLVATVLLLSAYFVLVAVSPNAFQQLLDLLFRLNPLPGQLGNIDVFAGGIWLVLFLMLVPLVPIAMTMALIWKIKEVILASVFGEPR
jgi:hypothetical protein